MAVITRYVVERNGVEKMTFTSKAEADAYDKMLDTADELTTFLTNSKVLADDTVTEALALYMAQQKDELLIALGAKKAPAKTDKAAKTAAEPKAKIAAVEQAA
ncbi:YebG family protein [Rheinheimera muenzenbergensis]|uniref:YebG family protein n=1 Tax=Rheinheimera muenzenbergensis TaxID=1193628 RepID=A0ABU8C7R4_9GAMM|nr:YebG family protein [Gammaproteobacteria bacterium]MBU1555473.1 YebG family protein [Gammaproteobacteria bacterium]MBU2072510.1 YebG family protein [Gammaproteobacteria bacterium]MBU2181940.1 YebG family protein [Gammaproteobacteria bacterium]MBU2204246.1 YebG family protein [Gammaproteobacteria bacterium]